MKGYRIGKQKSVFTLKYCMTFSIFSIIQILIIFVKQFVVCGKCVATE